MAAEGKGKGSQGARPPGPSCPINGRAVPLGSFYRESHSVALQSPPTQTPTCSGADLNGRSKHAALAQPAPPSTPHPPPPPWMRAIYLSRHWPTLCACKGGSQSSPAPMDGICRPCPFPLGGGRAAGARAAPPHSMPPAHWRVCPPPQHGRRLPTANGRSRAGGLLPLHRPPRGLAA